MKNNDLNPTILSYLYDNDLYALDKNNVLKKCTIFGQNHKSCIILVKNLLYPILSKQDLTFLENILKAIQYTLEDVVIINIKDQKITLENIQEEYAVEKLILFDILAFEIGIQNKNIRQYEVFELEKIHVLTANSLQEITQNIDKKKALWIALQRMFN